MLSTYVLFRICKTLESNMSLQVFRGAGLQLGEPYTSHGLCLLSLSRDVRGASYQKESGINSIAVAQVSAAGAGATASPPLPS